MTRGLFDLLPIDRSSDIVGECPSSVIEPTSQKLHVIRRRFRFRERSSLVNVKQDHHALTRDSASVMEPEATSTRSPTARYDASREETGCLTCNRSVAYTRA